LCGVQLQGERSVNCLQVPCPACGELVFVLPRSPYPEPRDLPAPKGAPVVLPPIPTRRKQVARGPSLGEKVRQRVVRAEAKARGVVGWFTPAKLLAMGAIAFVLATGWWSWSRWQRNEYVVQLERELTEGLAALDRGDFVQARGALERADRAGRGLGSGAGAVAAHQYYREARTWEQLTQRSLDDFFGGLGSNEAAETARRFQQEMAGRTAIFDTIVHRGRDENGEEHTRSDWQLIGDGYQVELEWEGPVWEKLQGNEAQRVIFGAELGEIVTGEAAGKWKLRLRGESIAWLTRETPLARFGWPLDDAAREVIERQRHAVGVAE